MKKKVDNLGRIILPAEVRRDLGIQVGVWYKIKNQGLCRECFKEIRCIEEQEY